MDKRLFKSMAEHLKGGAKGIEREALRVTEKGQLSQQNHPEALGSALTHSFITTDFSEALLEFVTPALTETTEVVNFLQDIHHFTYENIGPELLWAGSMPCGVTSDEDVPIAYYGSSNIGQMKAIYRRGLAHRYGRVMQSIAGVHFNYSLPAGFWPIYKKINYSEKSDRDFISDCYFSMIRNARRYGWLVLYLFGSSPAMCQSFLGGKSTDLPLLNDKTVYGPYATSLRMSDLGYKNKNQSRLNVRVNSLSEYNEDLLSAMTTPFSDYQKIGVEVNGEFRQLSANLLQIENEYYSLIRPKRVALSGQRPTEALQEFGVQYLELRALDVDIFEPLGISLETLYFLEAFLIYCLVKESPPISAKEQSMIDQNQLLVAKKGRKKNLNLHRVGGPIVLRDWATEIITELQLICEALDEKGAENQSPYTKTLVQLATRVEDSTQTPSARVLTEMEIRGESFYELALRLSHEHRKTVLQTPVQKKRQERLSFEAQESLARQERLEQSDKMPFREFLKSYLG